LARRALEDEAVWNFVSTLSQALNVDPSGDWLWAGEQSHSHQHDDVMRLMRDPEAQPHSLVHPYTMEVGSQTARAHARRGGRGLAYDSTMFVCVCVHVRACMYVQVFEEPFLAMAHVLCGGQERVFCNDGWAACFFDEAEVARAISADNVRPLDLVARCVLYPNHTVTAAAGTRVSE
jgi:hypothetical protein